MEIKVCGKTDIGKVREHNEDNILIDQGAGIFVVCDGMGGHASGEIASLYTCQVIEDFCIKRAILVSEELYEDLTMLPEETRRMITAIRLANQRIYLESLKIKKRRGMGTTVAAIYLSEKGYASIINIGDSRVYRLRKESFTQLTRDHTWLNELLEKNEITEKETARFSHKNVLTRALGIEPSMEIDVFLEPIKEGDIFLSCSDGLSGLLSAEEIARTIKDQDHDLKAAVENLITAANTQGGTDNISVVLVEIFGLAENPEIVPNSYVVEETERTQQLLKELIKKYYKIRTRKLLHY